MGILDWVIFGGFAALLLIILCIIGWAVVECVQGVAEVTMDHDSGQSIRGTKKITEVSRWNS